MLSKRPLRPKRERAIARLLETRPQKKVFESRGTFTGGFEIEWTPVGRKRVLEAKPHLLKILKFLRDNYFRASDIPDRIYFGKKAGERYGTLERIAGSNVNALPGMGYTRHGIFRIRTKNGKRFILKIGNKWSATSATELEAAFAARMLGIQTVEHFALVRIPEDNKYFVLMADRPLATLENARLTKRERELLLRRLGEKAALLESFGIHDAMPYNCFVKRKSGGGYELIFFDLSLNSRVWNKKKHEIQKRFGL